MFERFTVRARRVLVLAQEEARLLNHSFIGPEHLLLGLIGERDGIAAQALSNLGVTLESARQGVREIIGLSGTAPSGSAPFTPRAKKVLELSLREAIRLGHDYIGTEHMLLGIAREGENVAAQVLVRMGPDLVRVRQQVLSMLPEYEGREPADIDLWWPPRNGSTEQEATQEADLSECSFCGRRPPESGRLIPGRGAFICGHCIAEWNDRLDDEQDGDSGSGRRRMP
jgi:ATP-dependent Clp protease ATP-binding subunit ClpA